MINEAILTILKKYADNELLSEDDTSLLHNWRQNSPHYEAVLSTLDDPRLLAAAIRQSNAAASDKELNWQVLRQRIQIAPVVTPVHRIHFLRTAWFRIAVVLLLIAGTVTFLYNTRRRPDAEIASLIHPGEQTIIPGGNKAILTLSDGSTIELDSAANGVLTTQGGATIRKPDAGSLSYQGGTEQGTTVYNTVTTPRGGHYQVTLPDGSKVWLNAASSISFPTAFGKERKVTISGEAYLEVAPDNTKPFRAIAGTVSVDVLGTSFNINAYKEENGIRTTLIEGSVKIVQGQNIVQLKPAQQAQVALTGNIHVLNNADINQVTAWKNNLFNFEGITFKEIMNQLARWYDLEIIYEDTIPVIEFTGKLSQNEKLPTVLQALQESGVHFKLEGKKLTVMK